MIRRLSLIFRVALALVAFGLASPASAQVSPRAQPGPAPMPGKGEPPRMPQTNQSPPKVRSLPFVTVTRSDGVTQAYETHALPLLFDKACFGWRLWIGGPNRYVALVEVLTTSAPAKQIIAGPETEISADLTRSVTRMREMVRDGWLARSWCIIDGDPPGTYKYEVTIDGQSRGEFTFCALEVPDQDETIDPTTLSCPNRFHAVDAAPATPARRG
jgi:hypothetical protein